MLDSRGRRRSLYDRSRVICDDDPWKLDRISQRFVVWLRQRQALNHGAQSGHRGDGAQSQEPHLMPQRGRFEAKDFQSRPNAGEQNGGLPTPHEQPRRAFGRSRDKRVGQRIHFFPLLFDLWLTLFCWPEFAQPSASRRLRVRANGWSRSLLLAAHVNRRDLQLPLIRQEGISMLEERFRLVWDVF